MWNNYLDKHHLERSHWPLKVHREFVFCNSAELENYLILVVVSDELEVFDGCHRHAAIKVEHESANLCRSACVVVAGGIGNARPQVK